MVASGWAVSAEEVPWVRAVFIVSIGALQHALIVHIVETLKRKAWAEVLALGALGCSLTKDALIRAHLTHVTGVRILSVRAL